MLDKARHHIPYSITAAALALIPDSGAAPDSVCRTTARLIFAETCLQLLREGRATNRDLINELDRTDPETIQTFLRRTDPATLSQAAHAAETIWPLFKAFTNALQNLFQDGEVFSIRNWIHSDIEAGSILFISTAYTQVQMSRALITLWVNAAPASQMERRRRAILSDTHAAR